MEHIFDYIQKIAKLPSIHPHEEPVRSFIKNELKGLGKMCKIDEFGNLYLLSQKKIVLSAHMDKQAPPNYVNQDDKIQGKLDDAIGIAIILTLAENLDFNAFFSVGEEVDLLGSQFALDNGLLPEVEKAIVIDTSPRGTLGKGPIFYTSFNEISPSVNYLNEIIQSAKEIGITLQPMDGSINDGVNLIKKISDTIALEPHIENFHTSEEICLKNDVIDVYRVVERYLNRF